MRTSEGRETARGRGDFRPESRFSCPSGRREGRLAVTIAIEDALPLNGAAACPFALASRESLTLKERGAFSAHVGTLPRPLPLSSVTILQNQMLRRQTVILREL